MGHHLAQTYSVTENLLKDFRNSYRRHYNHIVHGKLDYCGPTMDIAALFGQIQRSSEILHQPHALAQLEMALRNESNMNNIALVGPSGVGKSLVAQGLMENFPWQENVASYAWNTYVEEEVEKFHIIRLFLQRLSDCGRNLLVIDNLLPCDKEVVPLVQQLIREILGESLPKYHLIVVYIFNVNSLDTLEVYERNLNSIQEIPHIKTINFRGFGEKELRDCIRREARMENLQLTIEKVNDIVETLDVSKSGCKNVHAKVLTHGQRV